MTRTSTGAPDPETVLQGCSAFGASVGVSRGAVTLLTVHDESGLRCHLIAPDTGHSATLLAANLEPVIGARCTPVENAPDLRRDHYARMVARPSAQPGFGTQVGADPSEIARAFARGGLPSGCWVAVTLRKASKRELLAARAWFRFRLRQVGRGTHYSQNADVLLASIAAGGSDADQLTSVLRTLAAVLPGFDMDFEVAGFPGRAPATGTGFVAALAGSGAAEYAWHDWRLAALAATPGLAGAAMFGTGAIRSRAARFQESVDDGSPPPPRHRRLPASKPRLERNVPGGGHVAERSGGYPLAPDVFLVTPAMVVGVASPHHGAGAVASVTAVMDVPPALRTCVGPVIGHAGDVPVRISQDDRWAGVASFGQAGSGKTVFVTNLFAYDLLVRDPSMPKAMVAIESKGSGARMYLNWQQRFGVPGFYSELGDPGTPSVSLLPPGDVFAQSGFVVSAMRYTYGETSIGHQSKDTLGVVLPAALLAGDADAAESGLPSGLSWMAFADVLLGGLDDEPGVLLATALRRRASATGDLVLTDVCRRLGLLYGEKVTPARRRDLQSAPRSKVGELRRYENWFAPSRKRVTFEQIIAQGQVLVINTGSPVTGRVLPDGEVTAAITSLLMYRFWHAVRGMCSGWGGYGRGVRVYSDELSLLAQHTSEVIVSMRNQGREFGLEAVFAAQYPEQLPEDVRTATLGFGTMLWLAQENPEIIERAVADLTKGGQNWTGADLVNLERFHGILRATVAGRSQPPVTVRLGNWDSAQYREIQAAVPAQDVQDALR